jgi:hypothetical protein
MRGNARSCADCREYALVSPRLAGRGEREPGVVGFVAVSGLRVQVGRALGGFGEDEAQ